MPSYTAPVKDFQFVLHDLLQVEKLSNQLGFTDATRDVIDAVLEEGGKFMSEVLAPLNQVGDKHGCKWDNGVVTTPPGFKEAYQQYCEAGWGGLTAETKYGGQGLPHVLGIAMAEIQSAANMAFAMYPGLTHGAYEALLRHGSEEQKNMYLPNIVDLGAARQ